MSEKQQAKPKIVQKMTRDGAVEVDKATGKSVRISGRDADVPIADGELTPTGKAGGTLQAAAKNPGRALTYATHRELSKSEDGNVGVEAAHRTEEAAENVGKSAIARAKSAASGKLKGNRAAGAGRAVKPDAKFTSKQAQKKAIKRGYAKAVRTGGLDKAKQTVTTAKKAAAKGKEAVKKAVAFTRRHWKGIGIIIAIALLFALLFSSLSSCGAALQGSFQSIITTSYTSEDSDIEATDAAYTLLESGLSAKVANVERDYPGYDEYRYDLAEIGHDPYELASYLTAKYQTYTPSMVQGELERIFNQQYKLTLNPVTETRYRTEARTGYREEQRIGYRYEIDPAGNVVAIPYTYTVSVPYTYYVQVPYSYYILNVKLTNSSLGAVALSNLTPEQAEMYRIYLQTKGNKPDLFKSNPYVNRGEYTDYDVPPEALTDTKFAAMLREAERYLGYPYVWGGSSPSTSFDCSGYVSWVINHSGWSFGRLTASGLMAKCSIIPKSDAKPGDLIFFQGTYATSGASHVGIYAGEGMMIHCGNPISYASINTPYWQDHFYCFGRLP
jgi:cell wall-associated NlpC family hydrolase